MEIANPGRNPVLEMILHLAFGQLRDGLYEDAVSTFSAARIMDMSDERCLRGRAECYVRMKRDQLAESDVQLAQTLRTA